MTVSKKELIPNKVTSHSLGRFLASKRVLCGINSTEMSKMLGLRTSELSMIEHGHRPITLNLLLQIPSILQFSEEDIKKLWQLAKINTTNSLNDILNMIKTGTSQKQEKHAILFALARLVEKMDDPHDNFEIKVSKKDGERVAILVPSSNTTDKD